MNKSYFQNDFNYLCLYWRAVTSVLRIKKPPHHQVVFFCPFPFQLFVIFWSNLRKLLLGRRATTGTWLAWFPSQPALVFRQHGKARPAKATVHTYAFWYVRMYVCLEVCVRKMWQLSAKLTQTWPESIISTDGTATRCSNWWKPRNSTTLPIRNARAKQKMKRSNKKQNKLIRGLGSLE